MSNGPTYILAAATSKARHGIQVNGEAGAALRSGVRPSAPDSRQACRRLFVALPRGHGLRHRTAVGWPALRNESFIVRRAKCDPDLCERVIKHLSDHTPGAVIQKLNVGRETLMHLVGIGRGLTITSEAAVSTAYPDVIFLPISGDDETVRFSAVWLRGNSNPAVLRLLSLAKVQSNQKQDQTNGSPRPNPRRSGKWPITLSIAFLGALSRRLGLST